MSKQIKKEYSLPTTAYTTKAKYIAASWAVFAILAGIAHIWYAICVVKCIHDKNTGQSMNTVRKRKIYALYLWLKLFMSLALCLWIMMIIPQKTTFDVLMVCLLVTVIFSMCNLGGLIKYLMYKKLDSTATELVLHYVLGTA